MPSPVGGQLAGEGLLQQGLLELGQGGEVLLVVGDGRVDPGEGSIEDGDDAFLFGEAAWTTNLQSAKRLYVQVFLSGTTPK